MARRPLRQRPADGFYMVFALIHIFAAIFIDAQIWLPRQRLPSFITSILDQYLVDSGDPLMRAALTLDRRYVWFHAALLVELVFQTPSYAVWIWGLWNDDARVYPLIVAHSTLAAITTLQVLSTLVLGVESAQLNGEQLTSALATNGGFLAIPAFAAVEVGWRCTALVAEAQKARRVKKTN